MMNMEIIAWIAIYLPFIIGFLLIGLLPIWFELALLESLVGYLHKKKLTKIQPGTVLINKFTWKRIPFTLRPVHT